MDAEGGAEAARGLPPIFDEDDAAPAPSSTSSIHSSPIEDEEPVGVDLFAEPCPACSGLKRAHTREGACKHAGRPRAELALRQDGRRGDAQSIPGEGGHNIP